MDPHFSILLHNNCALHVMKATGGGSGTKICLQSLLIERSIRIITYSSCHLCHLLSLSYALFYPSIHDCCIMTTDYDCESNESQSSLKNKYMNSASSGFVGG